MFNVLYTRVVPNDPRGTRGGDPKGEDAWCDGASDPRGGVSGGGRAILRIFFYIKVFFGILMLTGIYGCSTASFLSQAVKGHFRVMGLHQSNSLRSANDSDKLYFLYSPAFEHIHSCDC